MFSKIIKSTPFTCSDANEYMSNIYGSSVSFGQEADVSMLATLRVLLNERMPSDRVLEFVYRNRGYTTDTIKENTVGTVLDSMCGSKTSLNNTYKIYLHEFCLYNETDVAANLALVKGNFAKHYKGWKLVNNITAFFSGKLEVLCYANPELNSVYIFTSKLSPRLYHYLQCAIPAIAPWFFLEKPLNENELELMKSLTESSEENYRSIINKAAKAFDFRVMKIKKYLTGFEKRQVEKRIATLQREIRSIDSEIESYNNAISQKLEKRNEKDIILLGLSTKDVNDSEIMNYFIANKNISVSNSSGDILEFSAKGYLDYYDEESAKTYINNDRCYIYDDYGSRISKEDMKLLMTEIFLNKKLKIKFCAKFSYKLGLELNPIRYGDFTGSEFSEYTPNPHIDHYQCLGNSRPIINQSLAAGDSIMVIEQCIAATKNLNFTDSTVGADFMSTMYERPSNSDYNLKFIELPDGRVVKPSEAIEWIKAQEA